ncbi:lipocalin family protein [Thermomonas sp.]|uniref:lipocalin family protein n=1 Tax=Thermomonas sp. TaxID=1971895 RepID=UPI00248A25EB|nr:lipocalin family protein [Thermomonas sp.]MDI1253410.1 lipocalin family protein [Thermomonas sp.]
MKNTHMRVLASIVALLFGAGCAHTPPTISPVANVDLQKFMGDWYVIANIPSYPEREAYNAVESYVLQPDGRIETTFRFRKGGFDAPVKIMHPVGRVVAGTNNAVWDMQVFWPIKAEYVIVGLNDDYSQTIIGRSKRDYAWVMARTPTISEQDYQAALSKLKVLGYSLDKLRKVPQQWPEAAS